MTGNIRAVGGKVYSHNSSLSRCQGQNSRGQRYRMIDRNYTPFQSNVLCRRGILLSDSRKKALADRQGHQSRERLIE